MAECQKILCRKKYASGGKTRYFVKREAPAMTVKQAGGLPRPGSGRCGGSGRAQWDRWTAASEIKEDQKGSASSPFGCEAAGRRENRPKEGKDRHRSR